MFTYTDRQSMISSDQTLLHVLVNRPTMMHPHQTLLVVETNKQTGVYLDQASISRHRQTMM